MSGRAEGYNPFTHKIYAAVPELKECLVAVDDLTL
jgi:hypothetical protein